MGFFDGVHTGHAALIRKALKTGAGKNLLPSVITFDIHPLSLVSDEPIPLINSPEDRAGLIRRLFGIEDIIFLHFDKTTASMSWDRFVEHLADEFGARHLVAGFDFRFGSGGNGNSGLLEQKCKAMGLGCDIIPEVRYEGISVGSTYIRDLILDGEMELANEFLGHPHVLTDIVRYGHRLGRTLGTPTINMCFDPGVLVPAYGVYATKVYIEHGDSFWAQRADGTRAPFPSATGVTNVGIRPSVGDSDQITAETHILDYTGNLYGRRLRVEFYKRLRPEKKFTDINDLKAQIHNDCIMTQRYFRIERLTERA